MSLGASGRQRQLLALVASGEVARARVGARTKTEWAARLGMTVDQFTNAARRLREQGHDVPTWGGTDDRFDSSEFSDEEPTTPDGYREVDTTIEPSISSMKNIGFSDNSPPIAAIPPGHRIRGASTLVNPNGGIVAQWIKTAANTNDVDPADVLRAAFGEAMPRCEPIEAPASCAGDLLCGYWLGDPHCGMLAWETETGENFDLAIFERNLVAAADRLVAVAPPSKYAIVASVGDYFHSDGNNATTKGTRVDVDGRTPKMLAVGIRTMRRIIERALEKHEYVHVICARGNHDELLSMVLSLALSQFYENNPRVTVDVSPEMFHWYRFGANLIGVTHGDKAKPADLMGVMAVDRARDWGETDHRFIMCGHVHHSHVKEVPGVTVEYLRTLAPSDAWHRGQGYRSGRDLRMDVFHREDGRVTRNIVGVQSVRRAG